MGDAMNRKNQDVSSNALKQSVFGSPGSERANFFNKVYGVNSDVTPDISKAKEGELLI